MNDVVEPAQTVPTQDAAAAPETPRQRFSQRLWGLKALLAVALASVIIGGLGGAAIAKAGEGHDRNGGFGPGRGFGGPGGPGGFQRRHGGFGGQNGFGGQSGQPPGQPGQQGQQGQQQPGPSAGQTS